LRESKEKEEAIGAASQARREAGGEGGLRGGRDSGDGPGGGSLGALEAGFVFFAEVVVECFELGDGEVVEGFPG
jgi:hypothetical protein